MNNIMESEKQGIFLLAIKKSKKHEGTTYCIGMHRLGTPNMEFIVGELDTDPEYKTGDEISYRKSRGNSGALEQFFIRKQTKWLWKIS